MGTCPPAAGTASRLVGISKSAATRSRHDMTDRNVPIHLALHRRRWLRERRGIARPQGAWHPTLACCIGPTFDEVDAARDG